MKLKGIAINKAQLGWECEVLFAVQTTRQFTPEEMVVSARGQSMLMALWNGWRAAKRKAASEQATAAEMASKGWHL